MALRNYSSTAAATTLSAGVTSASTTLTVAATTGFPPAPFVLAVDAGATAQELVLVTAVAGTNLTVTRGYDSSVASAHDAGAVIQHSHAALDFREANAHVNATTGVHGTTGALVGTADTQTLTNKDLTSGTNSFPASLATTADTQTLTNKTVSADSNTINGFAASSFLVSDATGKADGAAAQKAIPAGAVVGTTDTQALTNKDLSSATNTFPAANPRGVLGYAQVTASQSGITTATDLTGLAVTVTVGSSRRIRLSYVGEISSTVSGDVAQVQLHDTAGQRQDGSVFLGAGAGVTNFYTKSVVLTPAAGDHTYRVVGLRVVGTGTLTFAAAASRPSYIMVEDLGAA